MTLPEKLAALTAAISAEAASLGLVFVYGPPGDVSPWQPSVPHPEPNNGQLRGNFLFSVAEG
jgi:hypothetical protein